MFYNSLLSFLFVSLVLAGCGGGGGSTDTTTYGVFYDSRVAGLEYDSTSHSGITDANGRFQYEDGETISFSVGDVVLGETEAQGVITPMTLVNVSDPNDDTVVNIARFLQTLDDDVDPDVDGIVIADTVRDAAVGQTVDFNQTIAAFDGDANVASVVSTLLNGARPLVLADDAVLHLNQTMGEVFQLAQGTWSGTYGAERTNCTDSQDHSFDVGSGNLQIISSVMNGSSATVAGTAAFTEVNFDQINTYTFTLDTISIDYLGNISGNATHKIFEKDAQVYSSGVLVVTGIWSGNSLIIRFKTTDNVGVTQSGDIQCTTGAIIRVSR